MLRRGGFFLALCHSGRRERITDIHTLHCARFRVSRCLGPASPRVDTQQFLWSCVILSRDLRCFVRQKDIQLKALCVGRHTFLAEHFARLFAGLGLETKPAVGLLESSIESRGFDPDVVICEYELLASLSLEAWERHDLLRVVP